MIIFYDTETCGLHGPIVLIQYAVDDGEIVLYDVWKHTVKQTMDLIEWMMEHTVCGFNLSFDHFHLCQMYTTLRLIDQLPGPLEQHIEAYALAEAEGRNGPCLKPDSAMDLMLHARKGPYQTLMNREGIRIKRVPTPIVGALVDELEARVDIDEIYFSRRKQSDGERWKVYDIVDEDGEVELHFKDVVLNFRPSTALKVLAHHALQIPKEQILTFSSVELGEGYWPEELGYAPFATAIGIPGDWRGAWPSKIAAHISHWSTDHDARRYAKDDVKYTRGLYEYFERPPCGDDDSVLACMVGAVRWRGFAIDREGLLSLKAEAEKSIGDIPTYHANVKAWVGELLNGAENVVFDSTNKVTMTKISELEDNCPVCDGDDPNCGSCHGSGGIPHPAAIRAKAVLKAREAGRQIDLFKKLLLAGRLHADLNVIGTKSSRMSGTGGLNVQGINKDKKIRSKFLMAFPGEELSGGDFSAFEVVLAIAVWGDKKLEAAVQQQVTCPWCGGDGCKECKGKGTATIKIHGLFGTFLYPGMSYEEIVRSDGSSDDKYTKSKSGLFAVMYGGEAYTLARRLGVTEEAAESGYQEFIKEFPVVGEKRSEIFRMFRSIEQPEGIGSQVIYREPADYIEEPILNHRRYFTLENSIIKAIFDLANELPPAIARSKIKVQRRDRVQTVGGAARSALYACAFAMQGAISRAAANHVIQSAGAKITKAVQRRIWELQPSGIAPWSVRPLNIHDEILVVHQEEKTEAIKDVVNQTVLLFKSKVPLLAISWRDSLTSWAEKK